MVTLCVTKSPSGCVLHVENLIESLTVTGGTEAVVLSLEHSPGVEELLSLAEWVLYPLPDGRPRTGGRPAESLAHR